MPSPWRKVRAGPEIGPAQPEIRPMRQRLGFEDSEPGVEPSMGLEDLALLLSGAPQAAVRRAVTPERPFMVNQPAQSGISAIEQLLPKAKVRGVYHSPTIQGEPALEVSKRLETARDWTDPKKFRELLRSADVTRSGGPNKALAEYNAIGAPYYGELRHPITREPVIEPMTEKMVRALDRGDYTELVPPYTILNKKSAWGATARKKLEREIQHMNTPIWRELRRRSDEIYEGGTQGRVPRDLRDSLYDYLYMKRGYKKINADELNDILKDLTPNRRNRYLPDRRIPKGYDKNGNPVPSGEYYDSFMRLIRGGKK